MPRLCRLSIAPTASVELKRLSRPRTIGTNSTMGQQHQLLLSVNQGYPIMEPTGVRP